MSQSDQLDNACGLIACLHSIGCNGDQSLVKPQSILGNYFQAAQTATPAQRAQLLEGNAQFLATHKVHAAKGQSAQPETAEDTKFHFVAYVRNAAGQLIELDGMKPSPHLIENNCEDLMKGVAKDVKAKIDDGRISPIVSVITLSKGQPM